MGTAVRFKNTDIPRQAGELARFKVVQGPDRGAIYVVTGQKATVGRGENNDIVISDLKASRLHAEINLSGADWSVKDLGSVNGIMHNGKTTKSAQLRMGDTFTLGETTLEFMTAEAGTMMLKAPARTLAQVTEGQGALQGQKDRIKKLTTFGGLKELAGGFSGGDTGALGKENRRKMILYAGVGLMLLWTMMGDDSKPKQKQGPRGPASADKGKA
ncbi:MAG TPA: FHA domain-containing protein, partial [Bdellovibrionota bacterium]|nr:FHA domain-containing protein [Bdellovibrionota bacterium]